MPYATLHHCPSCEDNLLHRGYTYTLEKDCEGTKANKTFACKLTLHGCWYCCLFRSFAAMPPKQTRYPACLLQTLQEPALLVPWSVCISHISSGAPGQFQLAAALLGRRICFYIWRDHTAEGRNQGRSSLHSPAAKSRLDRFPKCK